MPSTVEPSQQHPFLTSEHRKWPHPTRNPDSKPHLPMDTASWPDHYPELSWLVKDRPWWKNWKGRLLTQMLRYQHEESKITKNQVNTTPLRETKRAPITDPKEIGCLCAVWQRIQNNQDSESKLVQPLWKAVWSFLKRLKIELLYDPAVPLLCIHLMSMWETAQHH